MIIVSNQQNEKLKELTYDKNNLFFSYEKFLEKAFSEEGLDIDNGLYININDIEESVFSEIKDSDGVKFFTLNGDKPIFANSINVDNLYEEPIKELEKDLEDSITNLLDASSSDEDLYSEEISGKKDAKIYVFGSSKGGTGKTFTSIISTYRYAKMHPDQKIALVDFDIIDGQVGISIHKVRPTMGKYYTEYQKGYRDFKTMKNFAVKANNVFPQNVDFYLAPTSGSPIKNDEFWINIIKNCSENYDVVVFDTGIDYLNITPISYAYKIADKINLVTTTSIKSVNSITKQIGRLKGEISNPGKNGIDVFTKDDEIAPRLNVIITQMVETNNMNKTIYSTISNKCNVVATFGVITDSVSQAEFYGRWNIFDENAPINKSLDTIMS